MNLISISRRFVRVSSPLQRCTVNLIMRLITMIRQARSSSVMTLYSIKKISKPKELYLDSYRDDLR